MVFANKLAPNEATNISRNPHFSSFDSFSIFFETPLFNKSDSSKYLTIVMVSFISLFDIINVVISDPYISFPITATVVDTGAVNPNCRKILATSMSTFLLIVSWLSGSYQ